MKYLIKWEGYGVEHNTWEPRLQLLTCNKPLRAYHEENNLELIDSSDYDSGNAYDGDA